jgi:hypothetical protein
VPDDIKHYRVQFRATPGILVSLPCPYSADAKASGITYQFNGFRGPARIVQQRIWAGRWATVMACGPCGAKYRLPDLETAAPLLAAVEVQASNADRDKAPSLAVMWRTVAERIKAGYQTPTDSDPDCG